MASLHTLPPIISVSLSFVSSAASLLLEEAICPILMAPRNAKESDLQVVHVCEHFVFSYKWNLLPIPAGQLLTATAEARYTCLIFQSISTHKRMKNRVHKANCAQVNPPDTLQPVRDAFLPLSNCRPTIPMTNSVTGVGRADCIRRTMIRSPPRRF